MDNEVPSAMIPDSLSLSLPAESDVTCERVVIVTRLLRPDDSSASVGRSAELAENFKAVGHTASAAAPF